MRRERNEYERMVDNALLLSLWARAQEYSPGREFVGDRLKLMKLAFFVAYELYWKRIKALNTCFFRYKYGPYSTMVSAGWDDLRHNGLLSADEVFAVTEEGKCLADAFTTEVLGLPENQPIASVLNKVIEDYAPLDTNALLRVVYNLEARTLDAPNTRLKIEQISLNRDFTAILEEEESDLVFLLPSGWETTLALTFDQEARQSMERSIEDTWAGRVYSGLEALTADV